IEVAYRDQEQPEVADLVQQPVEGGLIGDRACDDGFLPVAADLEILEPGSPPPVEDALDPDLVARVQAHVPTVGLGPCLCTLRTGAGIGVTRRWLIGVESFRDRGGTMVPRDGAARSCHPDRFPEFRAGASRLGWVPAATQDR